MTGSLAKATRMPWWHPIIDVLTLFTVLGLVVGILFQWLQVYFVLGGPTPAPTGSAIAGYLVTAAIAVILTVTGLVMAIRRRSVAGIIGYLALGALVAAAILLFSVPQVDWFQLVSDWRNPHYPVSPDYCSRTDSENCPGG